MLGPMPGRSRSFNPNSLPGRSCGCNIVSPSGFCRSVATFAKYLLGAMPMEQRTYSPMFFASPALIDLAISLERSTENSFFISAQAISSIEHTAVTGICLSISSMMRSWNST